MIDAILSLIAPHYCCGCGLSGAVLCENCKYDIISEPYDFCVACSRSIARANGLCGRCKVPYQQGWCVADRRDALERLINEYKFQNNKAAYIVMASLLHERLPELPQNTVLVPVPTIANHIRQRGYDHVLLPVQQLAKTRSLQLSTVLQRATSTRQRGATATERRRQAKEAFFCTESLRTDVPYLVIDDVVTTGATLRYAAEVLKQAGAQTIWVATVSRQPLD